MAQGELRRCAWVGSDPLNIEHHDLEWGVPSRDRRFLFELLTLEGAQAGLSWITILRKRDGYRAAFANFEPERVAAFGPDDVDRLLLDPGIVRNRAKVESTIDNARAALALERSGIGFVDHVTLPVSSSTHRTGEPCCSPFVTIQKCRVSSGATVG